MKHLLKPLGHCLTTAVMTSAMLEVYALPAVEAAPPKTTISSESAETASPTAGSTEVTQSAATQAVASPEQITPVVDLVNSAPAVTDAAAPATLPAAPPENSADSSTQAASQPESAEVQPSEAGAQPSGAIDTSQPESHSALEHSSSVKPTSTARTVADMRQILEQRLATIVQQEKASKDAARQQNIVFAALQSAWARQFEQARQMATQPDLSSEVQTELLDKIAAIETLLTSPVAQKPSQTAQSPQKSTAGRVVPSGNYSVVSAGIPDYASLSLGNQCPTTARPTELTPPPKKANSTQIGNSKLPNSLSALAQNLASQLVQLSHAQATASATVSTKDVASTASQPIVAPQLFTGVAISTATQAIPTPSQTKVLPKKALPEVVLEPKVSTVASVSSANPKVSSFTESAVNQVSASTSANTATIAGFDFNQVIGSTLSYPLKQIGVSLWQFIPDPLNLAWNWLEDAQPQAIHQNLAQQTTHQPEATQSEFRIGSLTEATFATAGLSNGSFLQTLEQDFTLKPLRDVRKLSLPTLSLSKTTSAKSVSYDTASLLAMSCTRSQLTHYTGSYTIDPAASKRMGWVNLMFPLPIPAVITSVFGWRVHPISGNLSFHTGLDMGAPMGTPVLAALSGRVVAADYMGGYGLAVVIENDGDHERNLYGHLSGIAVQPGMQIKQGSILGWVGSTGNSTGPHLHFESQVRTESGWTAVDPLATAAVSIAKHP